MPSKKFIVIAIVAVIALAAVAYLYLSYNRRPANIAHTHADTSLTATAFVQAYSLDEQLANQYFLGKTVDVTGVIEDISAKGDSLINITLKAEGQLGNVSCLLDNRNTLDTVGLQAGVMHTIRGICTGYLMDVEMNRCAVIKSW